MTPEEIIEGNKLIANFQRITNSNGIFIPVLGEVPLGCELKKYKPEELLYHSSWDWLMPVVRKIISSGFSVSFWFRTTIDSGEPISLCKILQNNNLNLKDALTVASDKEDIIAVWKTIVNFIKKYNQQQA